MIPPVLSHDQQMGLCTDCFFNLSMNHVSHHVRVEVSLNVDLAVDCIWGKTVSLAVEAIAVRSKAAVLPQR